MATGDFGERLQAFYDGCDGDERRLVGTMCGLTLAAYGHLDEDDVSGFASGSLQDQRDSLSELGEEQQLRMQLVMDRMTKADAAASNLLKKFSDVQSQLIGNFK